MNDNIQILVVLLNNVNLGTQISSRGRKKKSRLKGTLTSESLQFPSKVLLLGRHFGVGSHCPLYTLEFHPKMASKRVSKLQFRIGVVSHVLRKTIAMGENSYEQKRCSEVARFEGNDMTSSLS